MRGQKTGDIPVAAILDADRSIWGDPEFEFASSWIILESLLRGSDAKPENSANAITRRTLHSIIYKLLDFAECNDFEK